METSLRGRAAERLMEINAYGQEQRVISRPRPPAPDHDHAEWACRSTLNSGWLSRKCAPNARAGAAVVLKVDTGEVLAMASHPGFDQSIFSSRISNEDWNNLIQDERRPLVNKCSAEHYPPGSTYKMVTMLAALEVGVDPAEIVTCSGRTEVGPQTFYCWKREGHGGMDMGEALVQSCDSWFYEMSQRIGPEKMAEVAGRLGFGDYLMIDVAGEIQGVVPTEAWKRAERDEGWFDGDTVQTSIGQGYVLATPLQLATMTARIANGVEQCARMILPELPYPAPDLGFDLSICDWSVAPCAGYPTPNKPAFVTPWPTRPCRLPAKPGPRRSRAWAAERLLMLDDIETRSSAATTGCSSASGRSTSHTPARPSLNTATVATSGAGGARPASRRHCRHSGDDDQPTTLARWSTRKDA